MLVGTSRLTESAGSCAARTEVIWWSGSGAAAPSSTPEVWPDDLQVQIREWNPCQPPDLQTSPQALWVLEPDKLHRPEQLSAILRQLDPVAPMTLVLLSDALAKHAVAWLDAGADRCLRTTTESTVLVSMLRAMRRRHHGLGASVFEYGPLRFDRDARSLFHDADRIRLTPREAQVAGLFLERGAQRVATAEIETALGLQGQGLQTGLVSLYVHRVNRKIRPYGVHIDHLRGYGYCLNVDAPARSSGSAAPPWSLTVAWASPWR